MVESGSISIELNNIQEGLRLTIDERKPQSLFELEDAAEHNEERFQLIEGCFYDYTFSDT